MKRRRTRNRPKDDDDSGDSEAAISGAAVKLNSTAAKNTSRSLKALKPHNNPGDKEDKGDENAGVDTSRNRRGGRCIDITADKGGGVVGTNLLSSWKKRTECRGTATTDGSGTVDAGGTMNPFQSTNSSRLGTDSIIGPGDDDVVVLDNKKGRTTTTRRKNQSKKRSATSNQYHSTNVEMSSYSPSLAKSSDSSYFRNSTGNADDCDDTEDYVGTRKKRKQSSGASKKKQKNDDRKKAAVRVLLFCNTVADMAIRDRIIPYSPYIYILSFIPFVYSMEYSSSAMPPSVGGHRAS